MVALNKEIFGLTVENHELVKLAYDSYLGIHVLLMRRL